MKNVRPTPRKLTVLRIDDNLSVHREDDPTEPRQDMPPSSIELYTVEGLSGVSRWKYALQWWLKYASDRIPDLVVADVRFEGDTTTPLHQALPIGVLKSEVGAVGIFSEVATEDDVSLNNIPTGLSHLKPFAALARAVASPIGIGIHTADADLWSRLEDNVPQLEDRLWRVQRCMAYLAAHEIGEVAAILGDETFVRNIEEGAPQVKHFCEWLQTHSAREFRGACRIAVHQYRTRLLALTDLSAKFRVVIMPEDLVSLMDWCALMQKRPKPINADNDPGLRITYSNGWKDTISLASLFSDVEDITTVPLPGYCFQIPPISVADLLKNKREEAASLDERGNPQIGSFVSALGTLKSAYEKAVKLVEMYADEPEDDYQLSGTGIQPLGDTVAEKGTGKLVRGLVMLFQILRFEKFRFDEWSRLIENQQWQIRDLRFGDLSASGDSLAGALKSLVSLIQSRISQDEVSIPWKFSRKTLFEDIEFDAGRDPNERLPWQDYYPKGVSKDAEWVKWHFDRLVEAGIIHSVPTSEYQVIRRYNTFTIPPVPRPANSLNAPHPAFRTDAIEWMCASLGVEETNAVGRFMCRAFVMPDKPQRDPQTAKLGREFLEDLLHNQSGPTWLIDICRNYAETQLNWPDRITWPEWLK